jgi:hypothetical protein
VADGPDSGLAAGHRVWVIEGHGSRVLHSRKLALEFRDAVGPGSSLSGVGASDQQESTVDSGESRQQ